MIIIWDTTALMERLHRRTLSDAHAFVYFFLTLMYDYVGFTLAYLGQDGQPLGMWSKRWVITAVGLTFFGVLYVYFRNGGRNGVQFFHRYFSLSVVIGIKLAILLYAYAYLPALLGVAGITVRFPGWLNFSVNTLLSILLFVLIGQRLAALRRAT